MVKTNTIERFERWGIIHPDEAGQVAEYLAEENTEDSDGDENS
jgi:hypothetical protein